MSHSDPHRLTLPVKRSSSLYRVWRFYRDHQGDDPVTITQVANELGLSAGAVHHHLQRLEADGAVVKRGHQYEALPPEGYFDAEAFEPPQFEPDDPLDPVTF